MDLIRTIFDHHELNVVFVQFFGLMLTIHKNWFLIAISYVGLARSDSYQKQSGKLLSEQNFGAKHFLRPEKLKIVSTDNKQPVVISNQPTQSEYHFQQSFTSDELFAEKQLKNINYKACFRNMASLKKFSIIFAPSDALFQYGKIIQNFSDQPYSQNRPPKSLFLKVHTD